MSLLNAIPGLKKHQTETAAPAFDREKAGRLIRDALSLISSFYPEGALEWLRASRPDITAVLKECSDAIDTAVLTDNSVAFSSALERFIKLHRQAFELYAERPPVIDVQTDLFSGVS